MSSKHKRSKYREEEEGEIPEERERSPKRRKRDRKYRDSKHKNRDRSRSRDRYRRRKDRHDRRWSKDRTVKRNSPSDHSSNGSYNKHKKHSKDSYYRSSPRNDRHKRRDYKRRDRDYERRRDRKEERKEKEQRQENSSKNVEENTEKVNENKDLEMTKEPSFEGNLFIEEVDEEKELKKQEEDRKKRIQEILAKHGKLDSSPSQEPPSFIAQPEKDTHPEEVVEEEKDTKEKFDDSSSSHSSDEILKKMDDANVKLLKMLEKERNDLKNSSKDLPKIEEVKEPQEDKKEKEVEEDKGSEESFDMFNVDSDEEDDNKLVDKAVDKGIKISTDTINIDSDGYYQPRIGEIIQAPEIGKKYKIISIAGKGVFSLVVKAEDLTVGADSPHKRVGIKIIRLKDIMIVSGNKEKDVLKTLNEADEADNRFIIRMIDNFTYRKHLCLVFEHMHLNLREILKKFGKSVGLSLQGVRMYATQLFVALNFLRKNRIIHADIKPDNILVTEDLKKLKLCDFGTAFSVEERTLTEYLASGYYRAPEVIIGSGYDTQIDVWASAVSLYEIYTGDVMFEGRSNAEMLRLIMEMKGKISTKMLKKGEFTTKHFDQGYKLLIPDIDPVTKVPFQKPISIPPSPTKSITDILLKKKSSGDDVELLKKFGDFLERLLRTDPRKRITPEEALRHPFIQG